MFNKKRTNIEKRCRKHKLKKILPVNKRHFGQNSVEDFGVSLT